LSKTKEKNKYLPSIFNVITLVISSLALYLSYQSYDLSKKQYKENHQLILKGQVKKNELDIEVNPTDSSKTFLMGNVFFPSFIASKDIQIQPNGSFKEMKTIEKKIKDFFSNIYPREKGFVQIAEINIPIMIRTFYASNGNTYIDRSIYFINLTFVVSNEEYKDPELVFNGLVFVRRLSDEINFTLDILDSMYDKNYNSCIKPTAKLE
jgi:hypothetical protein